MPKQDPFTLEERVERLEKKMRVIQWSHTLDWDAIAWDVVILILAILTFTFALIKC